MNLPYLTIGVFIPDREFRWTQIIRNNGDNSGGVEKRCDKNIGDMEWWRNENIGDVKRRRGENIGDVERRRSENTGDVERWRDENIVAWCRTDGVRG